MKVGSNFLQLRIFIFLPGNVQWIFRFFERVLFSRVETIPVRGKITIVAPLVTVAEDPFNLTASFALLKSP